MKLNWNFLGKGGGENGYFLEWHILMSCMFDQVLIL